MNAIKLIPCLLLISLIASSAAIAEPGLVNVPLNVEKTVTTAQGVAGLPSSLASPEDYAVVLRIAPLTPGVRYEATLTFDAGTDIGYSHAWVDGNPFKGDWASFVGIGTGTGTREIRGKQEIFLFSIDPNSTANTLYLSMRSNKPFTFSFVVSDKPTGVTTDSQDAWGYYFVTDFDADKHSPFLLKRGTTSAAVPQPEAARGAWVDIPVNTQKTVTTAQGIAGLPSSLAAPEDYAVVLRIAPLTPGVRYEATLTYDAGTDIGYGHAWLDRNPFQGDWVSFVGIGTGTGTRELRGKQDKFLFSIDPNSTSNVLYLSLRTNKPFTFSFGVSDKPTGVTPDTQDQWGYYFVSDFDADKHAPFLLRRGTGAVAVQPTEVPSADATATPPAPAQPAAPATGSLADLLANVEKAVTSAQGSWSDLLANAGKTVAADQGTLPDKPATTETTVATAQGAWVDVPVNSPVSVTTVRGITGLPASFGSADDYMAVLCIAPLTPGVRYEATLTFDAGTDIGYGHSWVDGNPFQGDWASFVGIGTGTGTRELRGKQEKFLFTIDPGSTANTLYIPLRTNKPFTFTFSVSDRPSGVTKNSQDQWGYYYVTDFDADRTAPFLLKRGSAVAVVQPATPRGPWIDLPVNSEQTFTTSLGINGLPSSLGAADQYVAIIRIAPFTPGVRYEATLTYDAGTDIGYGHAWVDGSPFQQDWASFVGIGTGTGSRELPGKQEKFLFTIDPASTSNALFLCMRTSKPFTFRFGVNDRPSGVTPSSQDQWGYFYVTDFDADKHSPFLLKK